MDLCTRNDEITRLINSGWVKREWKMKRRYLFIQERLKAY